MNTIEVIKQIERIQKELEQLKQALTPKEKEQAYSVYCHLFPNNKYYIGYSKEPLQRWANGKGYKSNKSLYKSIQQYKWENIKHLILYTSNREGHAIFVEQILIGMLNANNKQYGYNVRDDLKYSCKNYENIENEIQTAVNQVAVNNFNIAKLKPLIKAYKTIYRKGAKI